MTFQLTNKRLPDESSRVTYKNPQPEGGSDGGETNQTMNFRLDRTAFRAGTHEQLAEAERQHRQQLSPAARLRAAAYLNSVAYGYDLQNPPRLDRTQFSMRKHPD